MNRRHDEYPTLMQIRVYPDTFERQRVQDLISPKMTIFRENKKGTIFVLNQPLPVNLEKNWVSVIFLGSEL